ncbi:hypothetical protein ACIGKR_29895 [Rhodococcus qingshengii]|uniref:hypothetical protein n=1 Tax=Rhodococcus qingshengii TaxID=334542 RepID=UPI0037C80E5A
MAAKTTTERGLGWQHQKTREHLLRVHIDGTPCWWCGRSMYRAAERNPDEASLEADHSTARSKGGTKADRLLHSTCNRSRQAGSRDHQRPALRLTRPLAFPWPDLPDPLPEISEGVDA